MTDPQAAPGTPLTPEEEARLRHTAFELLGPEDDTGGGWFSIAAVRGLLATLDAARRERVQDGERPGLRAPYVSPVSRAGRAFHDEYHEDWSTECGPDCPVMIAFREERRLAAKDTEEDRT